MRNVEIKAKVRNFEDIVRKAKALSGNEGTVIPQNDTFYKVQQGRLKLRKFEKLHKMTTATTERLSERSHSGNFHSTVVQLLCRLNAPKNGDAELIYYERPDSEGPKLSSYEKCQIESPQVAGLDQVLSRALGTLGIVKKQRLLFIVGHTRVHIDTVEDLGNFMELEVVLSPDQSPEEGESIAHSLMEKLGVSKDDLVAGAYRDMLEK